MPIFTLWLWCCFGVLCFNFLTQFLTFLLAHQNYSNIILQKYNVRDYSGDGREGLASTYTTNFWHHRYCVVLLLWPPTQTMQLWITYTICFTWFVLYTVSHQAPQWKAFNSMKPQPLLSVGRGQHVMCYYTNVCPLVHMCSISIHVIHCCCCCCFNKLCSLNIFHCVPTFLCVLLSVFI